MFRQLIDADEPEELESARTIAADAVVLLGLIACMLAGLFWVAGH